MVFVVTLRHSDSDHTSLETKTSTSDTSEDESGGRRQVRRSGRFERKIDSSRRVVIPISLGGIRCFCHPPLLDLPQMANCCIHLYLFRILLLSLTRPERKFEKVEISFGVDQTSLK